MKVQTNVKAGDIEVVATAIVQVVAAAQASVKITEPAEKKAA